MLWHRGPVLASLPFSAHLFWPTSQGVFKGYFETILGTIWRRSPTGGERDKPLGFLTLGEGSWRKKIEEEDICFMFLYSSSVLFLSLMF